MKTTLLILLFFTPFNADACGGELYKDEVSCTFNTKASHGVISVGKADWKTVERSQVRLKSFTKQIENTSVTVELNESEKSLAVTLIDESLLRGSTAVTKGPELVVISFANGENVISLTCNRPLQWTY